MFRAHRGLSYRGSCSQIPGFMGLESLAWQASYRLQTRGVFSGISEWIRFIGSFMTDVAPTKVINTYCIVRNKNEQQ